MMIVPNQIRQDIRRLMNDIPASAINHDHITACLNDPALMQYYATLIPSITIRGVMPAIDCSKVRTALNNPGFLVAIGMYLIRDHRVDVRRVGQFLAAHTTCGGAKHQIDFAIQMIHTLIQSTRR